MKIDATLQSFNLFLPGRAIADLQRGEFIRGRITGFIDGQPIVRIGQDSARVDTPIAFKVGDMVEAVVMGIREGKLHLKILAEGSDTVKPESLLTKIGLSASPDARELLSLYLENNWPLSARKLESELLAFRQFGGEMSIEKFISLAGVAERFAIPLSAEFLRLMAGYESRHRRFRAAKPTTPASPLAEFAALLTLPLEGTALPLALKRRLSRRGPEILNGGEASLIQSDPEEEHRETLSALALDRLLHFRGTDAREGRHYFFIPAPRGDPDEFLELEAHLPATDNARNFSFTLKLNLQTLDAILVNVHLFEAAIKIRFLCHREETATAITAEGHLLVEQLRILGYPKTVLQCHVGDCSQPLLLRND